VVIETTALKNANRGIAYAESIAVTGGTIPYTWEIVAGSLPAGLGLNSVSGLISGTTHQISGHSSVFTVKVTDNGKPSGFAEKELTLWVLDPLEITTTTLQKGLQKAPFQADFEAEGGIAPYTWSIAGGSPPLGLVLDTAAGRLSGIPAECGIFDFALNLADDAGVTNSVTKAFQLEMICSNDYQVTGNIGGLAGVTLTLGGDGSGTTVTDEDGNFTFEHLAMGNYTLTPYLPGYWFNPSVMTLEGLKLDMSGLGFEARDVFAGDVDGSGTIDLQDLIMVLEIVTGQIPYHTVYPGADVDGDGRIGLPEALHILDKTGGNQHPVNNE